MGRHHAQSRPQIQMRDIHFHAQITHKQIPTTIDEAVNRTPVAGYVNTAMISLRESRYLIRFRRNNTSSLKWQWF
jgi:hypothetical protein